MCGKFSSEKSNSGIKKSPIYFLNRYLKHPFYKYQVYLILSNEIDQEALISIRIDKKNKSNVLRPIFLIVLFFHIEQ